MKHGICKFSRERERGEKKLLVCLEVVKSRIERRFVFIYIGKGKRYVSVP